MTDHLKTTLPAVLNLGLGVTITLSVAEVHDAEQGISYRVYTNDALGVVFDDAAHAFEEHARGIFHPAVVEGLGTDGTLNEAIKSAQERGTVINAVNISLRGGKQ